MTTSDWITLIGIALTFLVSIASAVISGISIWTTRKTAKYTNYVNTIVVEREKWSSAFREKCVEYLTSTSKIRNYYLPEFNNEQDQVFHSMVSLRHAITLYLNPNENLEIEKLLLEHEHIATVLYQRMKDEYMIKIKLTSENKDYHSNSEFQKISQECELIKHELNEKQAQIKMAMRKILKAEWEIRKEAVPEVK